MNRILNLISVLLILSTLLSACAKPQQGPPATSDYVKVVKVYLELDIYCHDKLATETTIVTQEEANKYGKRHIKCEVPKNERGGDATYLDGYYVKYKTYDGELVTFSCGKSCTGWERMPVGKWCPIDDLFNDSFEACVDNKP